MRIAICGSHSTGKSTLISGFLVCFPDYASEPEAFEVLGDEIHLLESEGPDVEGLSALVDYTVSMLEPYPDGSSVIFERSPVDYLAYADASFSMSDSERSDFLRSALPVIRASLQYLDLLVLLPVSNEISGRPGEGEEFRVRVDDELRRALMDDIHGLFDHPCSPEVVELPTSPEQQMAELIRRVRAG